MRQLPSVQAAGPLAVPQARPQAPQLRRSESICASQPLPRLSPSQSAKPAAQLPVQTPPEHAGTGTLLPEQITPQAPQLPAPPKRSDSQPLVGSPSQSPKPPAQEIAH